MTRVLLLTGLIIGACAAPSHIATEKIDLSVCIMDAPNTDEQNVLLAEYRKHFASAVVTADSRGGRECDVEAHIVSALNADKVTLRSAYDGSALAEVSGPVDLMPRLAAISLARENEPYRRVSAQRAAARY